jgi:hypothetical protein
MGFDRGCTKASVCTGNLVGERDLAHETQWSEAPTGMNEDDGAVLLN